MGLKNVFNRLRPKKALNAPGPGGETLLTDAIRLGDAQTVRAVLKLGADPDQPNAAGEYPLFLSIEKGDWDIFRQLMEAGADIGKRQGELTPQECARQRGREDMAKILARAYAVEHSQPVILPPISMYAVPYVPMPARYMLFRPNSKN